MENATKALLIGAGVLFAVVILSIAIFAYQNISGYYQTKQSNISVEQLAAFNTEYGAYERNLTGFELVGLINKVADFNARKEEDGYKKMQVKVHLTNNGDYNYIRTRWYTSDTVRDDLVEIIDEMQKLETTYHASTLAGLVANSKYIEMLPEEIQNIVGSGKPELKKNQLKKYEDYITFKRAKFEYVKNDYKNGQIVYLEYKSK